ncbi:Ig-like domain-containing protein [Luteolibacter sp. Populi]|uniref:Ig-like domain-containing protein n=1 Tax=Luteolibacter sp. Populi TaxID=3230487 RepID=UPI003466C30B
MPAKPSRGRITGLTSLVAVCLLAASPRNASAQGSGLDAPQAVGAYFNSTFPAIAPGQSTGWSTVNAFPNLTFVDPLSLVEIPGTNQLLLVGKNGQLWRFANNPATTQAQVTKVLEWVANTQSSEDQGFYSLSFHPEFGQVGSSNANYVYVCYNHKPALSGADSNHSFWRVSRFNWQGQAATGTIDPASEFVLMNQYDRCRWHNGGATFFDDDGYLYVVCGDGGDSTEGGGLAGADGALSRTQKLNGGLFSGVFKIDVDSKPERSHPIRRQPTSPTNKPAGWPASYTQGYGIPNDNPWLDPGGSILEEYHSLGLRSPHTMHLDRSNGDIWIGDVGEGAREEMTRAPKGSNAQWGFMEGSIPGPGTPPSPLIGTTQIPAYDYSRSVGSCIIGGMRYRGAKWNSELGGKLLFGDHARGRIYTAEIPANGGAPVAQMIVEGLAFGPKVGLGNFCEDSSGEVFLMMVNGTDLPGGTIRKLVSQGASTEPPQLLSQTGVFSDLATLATAPGVIPYSVANPLWSDAAAKQRWIILPNDGIHDTAAEKISYSEEGNWVFPEGTVFVKHFELPVDENNPSLVHRLETRFIVCTEAGGKYGFTYKWNAAGTDAELLNSGASDDIEVTLQDGSTETRHWDFPSRGDCLLCHNNATGQALGVRTASLNKPFSYPSTGRTANQLTTFNALGMLDSSLTAAQIANFIESRPLDDETAPLEHRVRSYFDSNCSHCHRPGGAVDFFDARLGTPLHRQGLINGLIQGTFDLGPDGRYIKPGVPNLSALHVRLSNVGNGAAMPPLAKNLVDQNATAKLQQYVSGLTDAEFVTGPSPQARYVRLTATSEVGGGPWTSVGEFSILDGNGAPIPISELSVFDFDSQELQDEVAPASRAIDGNNATRWHTTYGGGGIDPLPHHLTIDIGSLRGVGGFVYVPRQDQQNGRIANYQVHYSNNGANWTLMTSGTWPNGTASQRYDELVGPRKTRCQIAGPVAPVAGPFEVTVVFDMDVTDFTAGDLQVSGGSVSSLRGKGYYYVATISPGSSDVAVSVPAEAVNSSGLGSRASSQLAIGFIDTAPPMPVFTTVPAQVSGAFQIGLSFGEPVTGLALADFTVTNATLDSIMPDGANYLLNLTPLAEGSIGIEILPAAVTDTAGIPMGAGASVSVIFLPPVLARNAAEYSYIGGGMVLVTDAAAPHGQFVWLPDATYPGNFNLPVKTQHRVEYSFVLPQAGQWMLRGMVRAADTSSDSFWVELDGNQATGTIQLWDITPVGTPFGWDYMNNRNVADPVVLNLSAGNHTVTVFGRDDGTRLDRLEFESIRPLATLSTPAGVVSGNFSATLVFSESVTALAAGDFAISGGQILSISGSGASYTLIVKPTAATVGFSLAENAVTDSGGAANFASNPLTVTYRTPYEEWAFVNGVDGSGDSQLSDEDGDGIAKLLEFAFNLNPASADLAEFDPAIIPGSGLPRMVVTPGDPSGQLLSLQFLRRKNANLTYTAQFGSSLEDFSGAGGSPVVEEINSTWERVTIADPAGGLSGQRFGRVLVIMSPP